MRLVLQCAMCGTHHPVGTAVCSTCRASGVTQLRLMFECPGCGSLGLNPVCETCPPPPMYEVVPLDLDDELIVAEEVIEEPLPLDSEEADEDFDVELSLDSEEDDARDEFDLELDEEEDDYELDDDDEFEDDFDEEEEDYSGDWDDGEGD